MTPRRRHRLAAWIAGVAILLQAVLPAQVPATGSAGSLFAGSLFAGSLLAGSLAGSLADSVCSVDATAHNSAAGTDAQPGRSQLPTAPGTHAHCAWCAWPGAHPALVSPSFDALPLARASFTAPVLASLPAQQRQVRTPTQPRAPPAAGFVRA